MVQMYQLKDRLLPWPVWLSGLDAVPHIERLPPVQFPVRAHGWAAGPVPGWGGARGNWSMCLLHISVALPLFPPLCNTGRLDNTLLNNTGVKEEILRSFKIFWAKWKWNTTYWLTQGSYHYYPHPLTAARPQSYLSSHDYHTLDHSGPSSWVSTVIALKPHSTCIMTGAKESLEPPYLKHLYGQLMESPNGTNASPGECSRRGRTY